MGLKDWLIGGGVSTVADTVGTTIEKVSNAIRGTNPELEKELMQAQIELNKAEASSGRIFIAGWRPFIGWTCGLAIFWNYVGRPVVGWIWKLTLPPIDMSQLYPLVIALLGLGTLRTGEKLGKVQNKH